MQKNRFSYPVQFGDIRKGSWRMQTILNQNKDMETEEHHLWNILNRIFATSTPPANKLYYNPNYDLIGYGWEWAVYKLIGEDRVVKIPAGIFEEVNHEAYLQNCIFSYELCRDFMGPYVARTTFQRLSINNSDRNFIFQEYLQTGVFEKFEINSVGFKEKTGLLELLKGARNMLYEHEWMPDLGISCTMSKNSIFWSMRNIGISDNMPMLYDFTTYYDVFRLYPCRTKREIIEKHEPLERLILEIQKSL